MIFNVKIFRKHSKLIIFIGYFAACMIVLPAMTYVGWLWHFFGKPVMFSVDFVISAWIAYEMAKGETD